MAKSYFNVVDIFVAFISLITFVLDVGTDIVVCIHLFLNGQTVWGWLVAVFITMSTVVMSVFGLIWHIQDKTATPGIIVSHLLLVAPIERYLNVIWLGIKSYRTRKVVYTQTALRALSDVSVLRLIEAFLESAPQLVLQMYILLCEKRVSWVTGFSVGCSLLSLTWAVTAYCDTQCSTAHSASHCHRIVRLLLHWGWQLFMTSARIAAFVFFACVLHGWMFAVMGAHWLIAFVWISVRGTDYGTGCEKWLFRLVCAFIYIFVFLNLNKGRSRWRITAYYLLMLLENKGMLVMFLVMGDSSMILVSCLVVFAGFFMGLACMLMYYVFFHPSGSVKRVTRLFLPNLSSSGASRSSVREDAGLRIFSVESPRTLSLVECASSPPSFVTSNLSVASASIHHISQLDESSNNFQKTNTSANSSQKTLQMVWQSGMKSSSGSSSSSLVSTEHRSGLIKRTASFQSDKSRGSDASDSSLLPPLSAKNLSKYPKSSSSLAVAELNCLKQEQPQDASESDNMNVLIVRSKSPTLSRDSWSRLSDQNIQPLVLGDFTILGFDESSSTDKRGDSSSLSSQAKSLSLLDVSNLWKDVHVRLRATIAATIAAATGNSSSTDGTSSRNQSVSSSNSAVLNQENSLNSTNSVSIHSHNTAFMDSNSSCKEKLNIPQLNDVPRFSQHQESQSTLPDIFESFDHDELSDGETRDHAHAATKINTTNVPALVAMNCSSPFHSDSTLTVSKLEVKKSRSYLASQRKTNSDCEATHQSCNPTISSYEFPVQNYVCVQNSESKNACKGDSPFTDQELVALMAKSLRNYVEGNSSFDSNYPEREGLALTLDDLRVTPETSPLSLKISGTWKSQSGTSIIRNSKDSSPASSASKMNQVVSLTNADAKLSPNAFKQIEDLPQRLHSMDDLGDNVIAIVPHSHALKFIMDSYGSTTVADSSVNTPTSQKSFFPLPLNGFTPKSRPGNKLPQQLLPRSNKETSDIPLSSGGRGETTLQKQIYHTNPQTLDRAKLSEVRSGVSSTKKLNVHFSGASQLENKKSSEQAKQDKRYNPGSDVGGYVSGQYCPPLCASEADSEVNYIRQNLDHDQRNLKYDLSSVSKSFLGVTSADKKHNSQTGDHKLFDCRRRETGRRDSNLHKQRSDLLTLQHSEPESQKRNPSRPHPYQHSQSPSYQLTTGNSTKKMSNITEKPGRTTLVQSHDVHELTDDELHMSAEHVAEYFSKALDIDCKNKDNGARPKVHCPQTQRQVHGQRQPLQRLENSQHLSPEATNLRIGTRQSSNKLPNSQTQSRRHAGTITATSPEVFQQRLGHELRRQHQTQHTKDLPRARLLFECDESSRMFSRESKRLTPGNLIDMPGKSSSEVRFPTTQDQDKYFLQKQHIHKTKGLSYIN